MKKYDGLYIFAGSARDEVLDKMVEAACAEITNLSGRIITREVQGKKTFARPMKKRDNGVYLKIRFEIDPDAIARLTKRYRLIEDVFRVQFLAVDERLEAKLVRQAEESAAREAARAAAAEVAAVAAQSDRNDDSDDDL